MEDIIQKYKKEKRNKNIAIIVTSLALALWLNLFITNTNSWKYLKSSVINSQISNVEKADLFLENVKNSGNNVITLKSFKEMNNVKSLSFSLVYNKDNVSIKDKKINLDDTEIINLVDNDWYNTIILNFKNPTNIKENENILNIILEKSDSSLKESLNLVNSNMTDNENNLFILSTSWIEF